MSLSRSILPSVLLLFAVSACGDSPSDPGGGNNNQREIKADPSFAADINEIFTRRGCTAGNCHGGGAEGLTLTASAANNFAQLVNVQATQATVDRVIPGNADDSYLVVKLEGRQTVGSRMPQVGSALDAIDLTNIKNWINNGAPNN